MFGDYWSSEYFKDLWLLDASSTDAHWTELAAFGTVPSARYAHTKTAHPDNTLVVFGGWDNSNFLNDVRLLAGTSISTSFTSTTTTNTCSGSTWTRTTNTSSTTSTTSTRSLLRRPPLTRAPRPARAPRYQARPSSASQHPRFHQQQ